MPIKISTDSTADIPRSLRESLDISVLPLNILAQGREYLDGEDMLPERFYGLLEEASELPRSSQVNPYRYRELFESAYREGFTHLIHTSLNAKGSATWQSGMNARSEFYEEHPEARDRFFIHILDSATYSMGYGLGVVEAAKMAKAGESAESILAFLKDWMEHVRVLFVPLDLRFVKKSGRISAAAAFLGDAMGLKPVILFENGEAKIIAKVRGERKAIHYLLEQCRAERKPESPYVLASSSCPEISKLLYEDCCAKLDQPPELEFPLGCVISINTGPRAIGIVYRR